MRCVYLRPCYGQSDTRGGVLCSPKRIRCKRIRCTRARSRAPISIRQAFMAHIPFRLSSRMVKIAVAICVKLNGTGACLKPSSEGSWSCQYVLRSAMRPVGPGMSISDPSIRRDLCAEMMAEEARFLFQMLQYFGSKQGCDRRSTLRCSNGSNRGPWNATHRTHQRTDTHVHDSRRHPSICRGAYPGQDRMEDTRPQSSLRTIRRHCPLRLFPCTSAPWLTAIDAQLTRFAPRGSVMGVCSAILLCHTDPRWPRPDGGIACMKNTSQVRA
jgi:hypothetical protein